MLLITIINRNQEFEWKIFSIVPRRVITQKKPLKVSNQRLFVDFSSSGHHSRGDEPYRGAKKPYRAFRCLFIKHGWQLNYAQCARITIGRAVHRARDGLAAQSRNAFDDLQDTPRV